MCRVIKTSSKFQEVCVQHVLGRLGYYIQANKKAKPSMRPGRSILQYMERPTQFTNAGNAST